MNLFETGNYQLASGQSTNWKIECEALTDQDWQTIANLIVKRFNFSGVTGVPTGGKKLEQLLRPHIMQGTANYLIVDDVYTTGKSIRAVREELISKQTKPRCYFGVVVFSRAPINTVDGWVRPMFTYWT